MDVTKKCIPCQGGVSPLKLSEIQTFLGLIHKRWSIEEGKNILRSSNNGTSALINSKGEIFIQEHQVTYQKMVPKLLAIAKNRTDTRIYVRGDKNINYGRVLEIMGTLSGAGFSKVALISEPYKS